MRAYRRSAADSASAGLRGVKDRSVVEGRPRSRSSEDVSRSVGFCSEDILIRGCVRCRFSETWLRIGGDGPSGNQAAEGGRNASSGNREGFAASLAHQNRRLPELVADVTAGGVAAVQPAGAFVIRGTVVKLEAYHWPP